MRIILTVVALLLGLGSLAPGQGRAQDVVVNGVPLGPDVVGQLSQLYGPVPPGAYWYDAVSGLWGLQGGPVTAKLLPNMPIGGPLQADASGGGTGVYFNGRELHPLEYLYVQSLYGFVLPGRFWLNPQLVGGFEGGPPLFDLGAAMMAQLSQGGMTGGGYNRGTAGGGLMSDGNCAGYLHPGGATVMTGNC